MGAIRFQQTCLTREILPVLCLVVLETLHSRLEPSAQVGEISAMLPSGICHAHIQPYRRSW